jgi:uncharacterized DUF497 family protein
VDESNRFLAAATGFDWDLGNAPKVRAKHGVEPGECEQVFFVEPLMVAFDARHSENERRWQALGRTTEGRRMFLVFTMRGSLIRIIAARDMSRKERNYYDEIEATTQENSDL